MQLLLPRMEMKLFIAVGAQRLHLHRYLLNWQHIRRQLPPARQKDS